MTADAPRPPDPLELLRRALDAGEERPASWPAPSLSALAPQFPEFRIEARVGQGGMAAVYRAVQLRLGRTVALKVLRPDLAAQREFVERFLREARALASLNHPHVLTVHDFGERDGWCYLVTELVDGTSLRELMAPDRLSPSEVLRIVPQICAGLQFAHEHGIVHRDIKPENVLIDRRGQVKIADFGLAKLAPSDGAPTLTRASMVFGTPHYMAPEQWLGSAAVDHRADIYSLGVVLYELLTGKLPIGSFEPPSREPGVPAGVDPIVRRTLAREPAERYQQVAEVGRDVARESEVLASGRAMPADDGRTAADGGAADPEAEPAPTPALVPVVLGFVVLLASAIGLLGFVAREQERVSTRDWLVAERGRQTELMDAIRASVTHGVPWTGAEPEALSWYDTGVLEPALATVLGTAWVAATLALVSLLGVCAGRGLRGAARSWRLCAELLAWAPLPVLLDAGVLAALLRVPPQERTDLAAVAGLVAIGVTGVAFAAWMWHRAGSRAARPARSVGPALIAGTVASSLLLCASALAALTAPRDEAPRTGVPVPRQAASLSALPRASILSHLGVPEAIAVSASGTSWAYRSLDGQLVEDAFTFEGDRIARTTTHPSRLVPGVRPGPGPYLGQAFLDLTAVRGQPAASTPGPRTTRHRFADGTVVDVADRIVVAVRGD